MFKTYRLKHTSYRVASLQKKKKENKSFIKNKLYLLTNIWHGMIRIKIIITLESIETGKNMLSIVRGFEKKLEKGNIVMIS